MSARDRAVEVLADAFDEWMLRMHGIHSSCNHKVEAEAMADRLIANALLVTDEQREVYEELRARLARAQTLADSQHVSFSARLMLNQAHNEIDKLQACAEEAEARLLRVEALADEWASAAEPDGSTSLAPVRDMAALLRVAIAGGAA